MTFDMTMTRESNRDVKPKAASRNVKNHGWTDNTVPGVFALIDKNSIHIPGEYQRKQIESKVSNIARDFSWPAFGTLLVAQRPDGSLMAMDGAHRLFAVRKLGTVTNVPCMVFKMERVEEEAKAFIDANTNRKQMTAVQAHRAALLAGQYEAVVAQELVDKCERIISEGLWDRSFSAIGTLKDEIKRDEKAARNAFVVAHAICHKRNIHANMLRGLCYIEAALNRKGRTLNDKFCTDRLVKIGADRLIERITYMVKAKGKGGGKVVAEGIVAEFNRNLRTNSIEI
jgi:hypothetical protein